MSSLDCLVGLVLARPGWPQQHCWQQQSLPLPAHHSAHYARCLLSLTPPAQQTCYPFSHACTSTATSHASSPCPALFSALHFISSTDLPACLQRFPTTCPRMHYIIHRHPSSCCAVMAAPPSSPTIDITCMCALCPMGLCIVFCVVLPAFCCMLYAALYLYVPDHAFLLNNLLRA